MTALTHSEKVGHRKPLLQATRLPTAGCCRAPEILA